MNDILLYPYSDSYKWIFDEEENFRYSNTIVAITPNEWITEKKLTTFIDTEENLKIRLKRSSILWIVPSMLKLDFNTRILSIIKYAVGLGVKIFYTRPIEENEKNILAKVIPDEQWIGQEHTRNIPINTLNKEIFDIDTPVLFVLGLSKSINSLKQLLDLKKQFMEEGYKVALCSDEKEAQIFEGAYWLNMLSETESKGRNQVDKIILLNHYLKQIEVNENFDLIIIGILKGTTSFGRKIVEDFGVNAYSVSKAVRPDCTVLNVFYGNYGRDSLEILGEETANVIGSSIDFYNIVNKVIKLEDSESQHQICTLEVDDSLVLDKIKELNMNNIYCSSQKNELKKLANSIIEKLESYVEVTRL